MPTIHKLAGKSNKLTTLTGTDSHLQTRSLDVDGVLHGRDVGIPGDGGKYGGGGGGGGSNGRATAALKVYLRYSTAFHTSER